MEKTETKKPKTLAEFVAMGGKITNCPVNARVLDETQIAEAIENARLQRALAEFETEH